MRKSTKLAVVLAAAALLVAGFAFTTLAKGWVQEGDRYYFEDEYGMKEYNTWEKDLGKYYYLGDDGYMVVNTLVNYEGDFYYCGADGAKVTDCWQKVEADDMDKEDLEVEYRWYYFNDKGKAIKSGKKVLDSKTYWFNDDGKMLFGYVNTTDFIMTKSASEAFTAKSGFNAYCGTNEDGYQRKSEWLKVTVDNSTDTYEDSDYFWGFYQSNGNMATSELDNGILWKGQRYFFSADGKMVYGWTAVNTKADAATFTASYYGDADDGKMMKKGWAYIKPQSGGDDKFWFYFDGSGLAVAEKYGCVRKINGKFYAFGAPAMNAKETEYVDNASKMLAGMVVVEYPAGQTILEATEVAKVKDVNKVTLSKWIEVPFESAEGAVYYFSGDEANDGSLKKSVNFSQEFKDDTYTLYVDKEGKLTNGYVGKKYYINGYLMKASEDMRYEVKNVFVWDDKKGWEPAWALLSSAGSEVTKGVAADADGSYYVVKEGKIYKANSAKLCPAQMASNFNKSGNGAEFKYDGVTYKVYAGTEDTDTGITPLDIEKVVK